MVRVDSSATFHQAELFTVEAVQGYGALGRKERAFAAAIFSGCNQTEAARRAGIDGEDSYVRAAGCKLAAKGSVQAVLYQAWAKSGANIDTVVRQAAAISARAFRDGEQGETPERRASARTEWKEAATLLASIHGKLQLKISGEVQHTVNGEVAFTLPPSALPVLAQMRREVLTCAQTEEPVEIRADKG